jgi:rhodanese-related sulfurtransferase
MRELWRRRLWRGLGLLALLAGAWVEWRLLVAAAQVEPLSSTEVEQKKALGAALVDVRQSLEYRRGHIPGAVSIPLMALLGRWREVPQDRDNVLICQHGPRAVVAGLILRRHGFGRATMLQGGMSHWDGPVEA